MFNYVYSGKHSRLRKKKKIKKKGKRDVDKASYSKINWNILTQTNTKWF
jgi:hypothetical protein